MAIVKPILRIFDAEKAMEFYIHWLQFSIDWQHKPENSPAYLQISKEDIVLHLSEHHGDCTPGARVFIDNYHGLALFHQQLLEANYRYNRPALETPFYDHDALEMTVHDPFGNRLTFVERQVVR
jgi:hypothetical protein